MSAVLKPIEKSYNDHIADFYTFVTDDMVSSATAALSQDLRLCREIARARNLDDAMEVGRITVTHIHKFFENEADEYAMRKIKECQKWDYDD